VTSDPIDQEARAARFEAVFRANVPRVRAYVARRLAEGVDDVVAETFTVAWRRMEDVPPDALPWLLGVARRLVANQRRSLARRDALARRAAESLPRARAAAGEDPRAEAVHHALARLTGRDREILLLVERDGISREDAARVLGATRAEVRVRLHRARRRFARLYAEATGPVVPSARTTAEGASDAWS
jgi:RNA polymerase sigma-70 factor (ECF subfamily)